MCLSCTFAYADIFYIYDFNFQHRPNLCSYNPERCIKCCILIVLLECLIVQIQREQIITVILAFTMYHYVSIKKINILVHVYMIYICTYVCQHARHYYYTVMLTHPNTVAMSKSLNACMHTIIFIYLLHCIVHHSHQLHTVEMMPILV